MDSNSQLEQRDRSDMAGHGENEERRRSSSEEEEEDGSSIDENGGRADDGDPNRTQVQSEGALAEDENSPTSSSTASPNGSNGSGNENGGLVREIKRRKKPRSESSVVHDREKGISTCKHCGWIYSNPRPSAKMRREHRKNCGKFQSVHAWMDSGDQHHQEQEQDQQPIMIEVQQHNKERVLEIPAERANGGDIDKIEQQSDQGLDAEVESKQIVDEESESKQGLDAEVESKQSEQGVDGVVESQQSVDPPKVEIHSNDVQAAPREAAADPSTSSRQEQEIAAVDHDEEKTKGKMETSDQGYDLERILQEQTSHHLLCPNCGSCITRRVILKKRKRTVQGGESSLQPDQAKALKVEEAESVRRPQQQQSTEIRAADEEEESEAWGCLACFAIFFRQVRDGFNEPLRDRAQHFSCLPYLLPDFHWDGTGSFRLQQSEEPAAGQGFASCLPIGFPWATKEEEDVDQEQPAQESREVEIVIDLTRPSQTIALPDQQAQLVSSSEPDNAQWNCLPFTRARDDQQSDGSSCLPSLLPKYWDGSAENQEQEISAQNEAERGGLSNCIPALLPSYTWGSFARTTETSTISSEERDLDGTTQTSTSVVVTSQKEDAEGKTQVSSSLTVTSTEKDLEDKSEAVAVTDLDAREPEALAKVPVESETPREKPQVPEATSVSLERTVVIEEKEKGACDCLPWHFQKGAENENEKADLNCLPLLIPSYAWGAAKTDAAKTEQQPEVKSEEKVTTQETGTTEAEVKDLTVSGDKVREESYISKETRIQAWIKTFTKIVTIKSTTSVQVSHVQADDATKFVDMTVSQKVDAVGQSNKPTTKSTLVSTPSTGWAWLDALQREPSKDITPPEVPSRVTILQEEDDEEDNQESLIDKRKRQPGKVPQTEIEEVGKPQKLDKAPKVDELRQPLLTPDQREIDVQSLVDSLSDTKDLGLTAPAAGPVKATVSVRSPDALIQVKGDDPKQAVETALSIADMIPDPSPEQPRPQIQEYVKSIVYGGLDVTLTSLAVVSSGAGAGTKTINVLALSLANLVAGLITLFHNIGSLYQSDYAAFEQCIGQSLSINGSISIVSFLVFGCVAPLTYGFSFRSSGDKDYKFAATAAASLACLCLLGLGKAHVQKKSYAKTIVNLLLTGFVASVAGYFVGDYLKRWLQKMGLDDETSPTPAPSPPSPIPFPSFDKASF